MGLTNRPTASLPYLLNVTVTDALEEEPLVVLKPTWIFTFNLCLRFRTATPALERLTLRV